MKILKIRVLYIAKEIYMSKKLYWSEGGGNIRKALALATVLLLLFSLVLVSFTAFSKNSTFHQMTLSDEINENKEDHPWSAFRRDRKNTGLSPYDTSHIEGMASWSFNVERYIKESSPAICENNIIYQGSSDGNFYALYPNGTEKWNIELDSISWSSPAIGEEGTIYIGSGDGNLYAINQNGTEKWIFETGGLVDSSPTIGEGGTIFIGSHDNNLYAVNPDGTEKWSFETGNWVRSSPAIGEDGTIYIGSRDDNLYAINSNGTEKWNFTMDDSIPSSPAIGNDGTIYVGSRDNNLYAINPDGTEKWSFETNGSIQSSPAIDEDGTIYVGSDYNYLYAVDPDGEEKWRFETDGSVRSSPAISDEGTIYVGGGRGDNNLYAIRPDGEERWRFPARSYILASPAISEDGTIYIGSRDGFLYAIGNREEDYSLNISNERVDSSYGSSYDEKIEYTGFGTTDPEPGEHKISPGDEVTVSAISGDNWHFSHWSSDFQEERIEKKEITINMTRNKNLTAHFRILEEAPFGTEKEKYEPGEHIIIEITNHGSGGQIPLRNDLGLQIKNKKTGEVVLNFTDGVVLQEALTYPHTEYVIWNQTDPNGEQVPEGTYKIISNRIDYAVEFTIGEDDKFIPGFTMLPLMIALIVSGPIYRKNSKRVKK